MSLTEPMPSQRGHMPPWYDERRASRSCSPLPFSTVIAPTRADRRDVEGEGVGRADVRLAEAAEQHAQHRVGVGRRADRRAGVGAHPLLVDDDRGRQPFQHVDLGPGQRRHEPLHERAVGLVDQPLRLRRDGAEHQRRLARSRDAGEHGQPPLGDLDADVLQVVLPGALDADQVVAVCGVLVGGHVRDHVIERRRVVKNVAPTVVGSIQHRRCPESQGVDCPVFIDCRRAHAGSIVPSLGHRRPKSGRRYSIGGERRETCAQSGTE